MLIGYARVSRVEQNLDMQIEALKKAGCEKIFTDKISGAKDEREGLNNLFEFIRPGDTLIVYKLSRISRSLIGLINMIKKLEANKITIKVITQNIDTSTPEGRMFINMVAVFNEFNRELIVENTRAGVMTAREKGKHIGRPLAFDPDKKKMVEVLLRDTKNFKTISDVIRAAGISRTTFYRYFNADEVEKLRTTIK